MTQAKRNFCKAATAVLLAFALLLALAAGIGVLGASAEGEGSTAVYFHKVKSVAVNSGGTVQLLIEPSTAYKLDETKDTGNPGPHLSGKRYAKESYNITADDIARSDAGKTVNPDNYFYRKFGYGYSGTDNTFDQSKYDAYDVDSLADFYKNVLVNGHNIMEWWNGVETSDGTKEYKTLYMTVADGLFDIQNYVTKLKDNNTAPVWTLERFANGDTVTLKKGLKLCSRNKNAEVENTWSYYKNADDKEVVLDRTLQFKYVAPEESGNGEWVLDEEALDAQATKIGYSRHGAPTPSMFDIAFEASKYAPHTKGTNSANVNQPIQNDTIAPGEPQWKQTYQASIDFYDNILLNGHTPWEWWHGVEIDGETVKKPWGIHLSHEANWVNAYGGDYFRFDCGQAFADGDTIVFNEGLTLIEKVGNEGTDWTYYADENGNRVILKEKLMFQRRNGAWVRTDLDAIADGVDANGKVTLATTTDKKYNLAVTVSDGLFTNTVESNGFKGVNFENKRADAAYTDFFDNLLFNGATANKWYTDGVQGVRANFNIHVTADGLKISKKDLQGGNIDFAVGDTVRFVGGFSFPSYDNDVWGFYKNTQDKRVVIKNTVEYKLMKEGDDLVWKKSYGVFKAVNFDNLPTGEPVVAVGDTVQYTATAVKVNVNDDEVANILYSSSDTDVATVAADGTVTGKKVGYTTITATIESESAITANYEIFVYDGSANWQQGIKDDFSLYIPMGKSNGEYYITDPLQKGLKSIGYKVEEVTGNANYSYKITVYADLYTNSRRPKDLVLPLYYGKGGGAKGDIMLTDGTGKTAAKASGYLLGEGDVTASLAAADGSEADGLAWKTEHEAALTVSKTSGEAILSFEAFLPASPAYHGVFGEVQAKAHSLGSIKALVVLAESEGLETKGKFLSARANETGDVLFDYGQWNQALNNGNGKWITYPVSSASDFVDGDLWKGWNNFQHSAAAQYNAVKEDFFDKILINGMTHKEYSAAEGVDLNIHMRSEYMQIRQYGARGQDDYEKMRQWKDGTTIEFKQGFRLIEKHKDGKMGESECTLCYLHEDIGRYWTLEFDQKYIYSAETNSWACYNDIASVALDKTEAWLKPGESVKLTATVVKAVEGSTLVGDTVTFTSSDTALATVDAQGNVTAAQGASGVVVITATAEDGKTATCTVTIADQKPNTGGDEGSDGKKSGCGCGNDIDGASLALALVTFFACGIAITFAKKRNRKA